MGKIELNADTIIRVGKDIPLSAFRAYLQRVTGEDLPGAEFQPWLVLQSGKTLGEAAEQYHDAVRRKSMDEILLEKRFSILSDADKAFILAFDEGIGELGYDFGGGIGEGYVWGKLMIIYSKMGVKSKKVAARVFIREKGIVLRLFFTGVEKHTGYIEGAAEHIKAAFRSGYGDCTCNPKKENCKMRKTYTFEGTSVEKCSGVVFEFHQPTIEKLDDYLGLLAEFYPVRKKKPA